MEVSIVQLLMKNSQIRQFKYFKVLIQEFHIKVDLGFVNAIVDVLQQTEQSEGEEVNTYYIQTVKNFIKNFFKVASYVCITYIFYF